MTCPCIIWLCVCSFLGWFQMLLPRAIDGQSKGSNGKSDEEFSLFLLQKFCYFPPSNRIKFGVYIIFLFRLRRFSRLTNETTCQSAFQWFPISNPTLLLLLLWKLWILGHSLMVQIGKVYQMPSSILSKPRVLCTWWTTDYSKAG